ncbi:MAG: hypothetical protein ACRD1K_13040 [Acidimicrobiales bacterium]
MAARPLAGRWWRRPTGSGWPRWRNLVENALKFAESRITVSAARQGGMWW